MVVIGSPAQRKIDPIGSRKIDERIMNPKLNALYESLVPFRIISRRRKRGEECAQIARQYELYRRFVPAGSLAFDIGANVGNRIAALLRCGARVVAVEPQESCVAALKRDYGSEPSVTIVNAAVGPKEGRMVLHTSEDRDTLASVSEHFISRMRSTGRFGAGRKWDKDVEVDVITLDMLIERFGTPSFIKIDVEGFELEALSGLSRKVAVLSFEWTPDLPDNARRCVERCWDLGMKHFQSSFGESMQLTFPNSTSKGSMESLIDLLSHERALFGDIYASSEPLARS
jgi:FkbM family methyltransferase